jgi:flagellar hook capping protein FlgD
MKRIELIIPVVLMVLCALAGASNATTPQVNGATIETRTFNDCALSTLSTTNNYPAQVQITDAMSPLCVGFANLHSFSFSADGGATAARFDNNSNFHFGADFMIDGAGQGEGGLRISPWYGKLVDGRMMANVTTGEVACFGGALPFYSFTVNHGVTYTRGTTIHMEVTYLANDLSSANPASIQYRVVYNGNTYDSPVLPFGEQNPDECNPNGLWGMLNDGRAGGYFQPRADTGESLSATWSNITFESLLPCGTPAGGFATIETRTFNDCALSTLNTTNSYPALVQISDEMNPLCVGFANLHSFSISDDGVTAARFDNNSNFHLAADFQIDGAGQGEGGLRVSPWYGQLVDGRMMANATTGEIACFGGALPFYSFTVNHGVTYTRGTTIHMEVTYTANNNTSLDPATIQYRVIYGGNTYDSPVLPFGEQNPDECEHGLWGMLQDGRIGGYFQPRADTGALLSATWSNIEYSTTPCCTDVTPPEIAVTVDRDLLWPPNHKYGHICASVSATDDCDPNPVVTFQGVTSSEPDAGLGNGDQPNDIVIGDDNCFDLRSERGASGPGRVYTITYCATDAAGHTTCGSATVTVPHDMTGSASASLGFTQDGRGIQTGSSTFALVLRGAQGFDVHSVDTRTTQVGNNVAVIDIKKKEFKDVDGDGSVDLRLTYDAPPLNSILAQQPGVPVALRYDRGDNGAYVVPDIFALGTPLEMQQTGINPGTPSIIVMRAQPNPFRASTVINYSVGTTPRQVDIAVFDASGRLVKTLVSGIQAGSHQASWDGRHDNGVSAAAGVYFVKANVAGQQSAERVILIR